MRDHRYVDELSVEELETVLRLRRRQKRLQLLGNKPGSPDALARRSVSGIDGRVDNAGTGGSVGLDLDLSTRYSATVQADSRSRGPARPVKWRWIRDQFLLFVEILAILGLLWIVGHMFVTVNQINEDSRGVQTLPTVTPTPIIGVFVLPGGHTPPDANQASEPDPIPMHLRDLVAEVTPLPVPTRGAEHAQRIIVPAIGVDAPVVEGDDWESLKKGAGHYIGSANPGERGNAVISAHNDIYGEIFRGLPELSVGDEITLQTLTTSYTYVVEQTRIVAPTEISVMDSTSTPVLTLISCYPYRVDTHRIVVIASLVTD
ncbi:MAG: class D sortase [Anaerolineae bacterium]|nr:class D sortase [Anaerolineae bacterium]